MSSQFNTAFEDVVSKEPLLYGDFMIPNVENKVYSEIEDHEKVGLPQSGPSNISVVYSSCSVYQLCRVYSDSTSFKTLHCKAFPSNEPFEMNAV